MANRQPGKFAFINGALVLLLTDPAEVVMEATLHWVCGGAVDVELCLLTPFSILFLYKVRHKERLDVVLKVVGCFTGRCQRRREPRFMLLRDVTPVS